MDEKKIFGELLRDLRYKQSLSQEKLSELTGLDRTFISLIERGERNPTFTTILKLSKGLHVKPSVLFSMFEERYAKEKKTV